jgi:hypothetical protein
VASPVRELLDTRLAWLKERKVNKVLEVHLERRRIRCGGRRCGCRRGELHGPYTYLRYVPSPGPKRKRIRVYIPKAAVRKVSAWLERFRALRADDRLACRAIRVLSV